MHRLTRLGLFLLALFIGQAHPAFAQEFVHPGGLHTQADLDRMKAKVVAGENPWIDGWNALIRDSKAQTDYRPAPHRHMMDRGRIEATSDGNSWQTVEDHFQQPVSGSPIVNEKPVTARYLLECVSRDGAAAICVALRPDGTLDPGSVSQLKAVGEWMAVNGAGIYGSSAWSLLGEGSNKLPMGSLTQRQANAGFTTSDFRYTVGADGFLYAYCLTVPAGGAELTLTALGKDGGRLAAPITSVELLGSKEKLIWNQTAMCLNITCPASMPFQTAVGFKIGIRNPPGKSGGP